MLGVRAARQRGWPVSRVTCETRKAYTVNIGGKRRRFWTEAAAYYALAKSLLGDKYLASLRSVEAWEGTERMNTPDNVAMMREVGGAPSPTEVRRAARARELFTFYHSGSYEQAPGIEWRTDRWQAYVRRVAKKMRALDGARASLRDGEG